MNNTFGKVFRITTWGESHGKAIGVVIDGCPSGIKISEKDIYQALKKRAPGKNIFTSARKEADQPEILSGIFHGETTGTPISIIIKNKDIIEDRYSPIKNLLRPGHANYSYLKKYGIFDYPGGGRSSGRETACRVAAGAVAKKILKHYSIETIAYLQNLGDIACPDLSRNFLELKKQVIKSPVFCPDPDISKQMIAKLASIQKMGDSLGAIITFITSALPSGLGNPIYGKLESMLSDALMSIPGSKGFEIGSGFSAAKLQGSEYNDLFIKHNNRILSQTNHSGGVLGGISYGMPLIGKVAFKPTSSIMINQPTLTIDAKPAILKFPPNSKHDPCIAIRAVPVVEAMVAIVLTDALLMKRLDRI